MKHKQVCIDTLFKEQFVQIKDFFFNYLNSVVYFQS